mgnify:CR=1 FL=1
MSLRVLRCPPRGLLRLRPGFSAQDVAEPIRRWDRLTVYDRGQMEGILVGKLIATSARQIGMFLIGTRNRTIAWMSLQQALVLGVIGFVVGKSSVTFAAPLFPKYVLLMPLDSAIGFLAVLLICVLASIVAIRLALQVDPAEAIG